MTSETRRAYGSFVRLHGSSRPWRSNQARSASSTPATLLGELGETSAVPQDRAGSPRSGVLGRARISNQYERSLRPCLAPPIAPLRRAKFRQTLLAAGAGSAGTAAAGSAADRATGWRRRGLLRVCLHPGRSLLRRGRLLRLGALRGLGWSALRPARAPPSSLASR